MATKSDSYASESGHWYDAISGAPCYTVIGKNGKERNTTLRDARQLGLVPSVTTIIKCASAPALTNWLIDQALMAALTLPRLENESLDDFMKRAKEDSKDQSIKAAEAGTELHGSLERYFSGQEVPVHHRPHCEAVNKALSAIGIEGHSGDSERSFASPLGYGGKLDLSGNGYVVDFKSKPFIEDGKDYDYDEHVMQLAAYAHGLDMPDARLINVFVGIRDAKVSIKEWTPEESIKGWQCFESLLRFWQYKNQHFPAIRSKHGEKIDSLKEGLIKQAANQTTKSRLDADGNQIGPAEYMEEEI